MLSRATPHVPLETCCTLLSVHLVTESPFQGLKVTLIYFLTLRYLIFPPPFVTIFI